MSHPDQPKVLERRWRSETPNESDPDDAGTGLTGSSSPTRTFSGALAETANINRRTGDAELAKLVDLFQKLGLSTNYANLPIALYRVLVLSCQECQRWSWCVLRSDSLTTKRCLRCGSSETATSSKSCERSPNAVRVLERQPEVSPARLSAEQEVHPVNTAVMETQVSCTADLEILVNIYDEKSLVISKMPVAAVRCPGRRSLVRALRRRLAEKICGYKPELRTCKIAVEYSSKKPLFSTSKGRWREQTQRKTIYRKWYLKLMRRAARGETGYANSISVKLFGDFHELKSGRYGVRDIQKAKRKQKQKKQKEQKKQQNEQNKKKKKKKKTAQNTAVVPTNVTQKPRQTTDVESWSPKKTGGPPKKRPKKQHATIATPAIGFRSNDMQRANNLGQEDSGGSRDITKVSRPETNDGSLYLGKRKRMEYLSDDSDGIE